MFFFAVLVSTDAVIQLNGECCPPSYVQKNDQQRSKKIMAVCTGQFIV